jgi:hypothetical protein
MDMLPIRPTGGDYIKPATSTTNDGGSKSQSGYIPRGERKEKKDELIVSDESKRLIGEDNIELEESHFLENIFAAIKEFFASLIKFILKIFRFPVGKGQNNVPADLFAEKK